MGVLRKIKSFTGEHLLTKEKMTDQSIIDFRLQTCNSCPNNIKGDCRICWCMIDIKIKSKVNINPFHLHLEETHCPLGKWNDKEIANHYRKIQGRPLI
jgi:hypothetical protein